MMIPTTLEILRRAIAGEKPAEIAARMYMGIGMVNDALKGTGYPDVKAMTTYRNRYKGGNHNAIWATADLAAQLAQSARADMGIVHAHTDTMTHQELRGLVAVMAAMLPVDVEPRDALAWCENGTRRGRPRKVEAA